MTERERLTERVGDGIRYYDGKYHQTCYPKNNNLRPLDKLAVKLCELEDKIENGTLLELPCKVGDTVYIPRIELCEGCSVEAFVITHIITDETLDGVHRRYRGDGVCPILFTSEKLGKTVFLTKEEAEKALAERKDA